ncbi:MAG: hypothetical protein AAF772_07910 [Acidobacteriota bacterium]
MFRLNRLAPSIGSRPRVAALLVLASLFALLPLAASPLAAQTAPEAVEPTADLLLPYFEVDTLNGTGRSTLFAVRNETNIAVDVIVRYYEVNLPQLPQRTERVTLASKETLTQNLRFVPDLRVDEDGIARGYVVISTDGAEPVLQGDWFRIDFAGNFATGDRLVQLTGSDLELCQRWSARFFNGGAFDGGATFFLWLDSPLSLTFGTTVGFYSVYDEQGSLAFSGELQADRVAFALRFTDLLLPLIPAPDFGTVEFEFADELDGYVTGVLDATNRYSVGFSASCVDDVPLFLQPVE